MWRQLRRFRKDESRTPPPSLQEYEQQQEKSKTPAYGSDSLLREPKSLRVIKPGEIESIRQLGGHHPVFKVTFKKKDVHGSDALVVKVENAGDEGKRFAATADIMAHVVDPNAAAQVLTPSEKQALLGVAGSKSAKDAIRAMLANGSMILVKMKLRNGLADLGWGDHPGKFTAEQMETLEKVMPKLPKNQRVWHSLGEIVAVDLFLGSGDRIAPAYNAFEDPTEDGPKVAKLENPGNIFFMIKEDGILRKALALDNYDPAGDSAASFGVSPYGNMQHLNVPDRWAYDFAPILRSEEKAKAFLATAIQQLVEHGEKAGVPVELGKKELRYFFEGYQLGVSKLREYLRTRKLADLDKKSNRLPVGIVSRAKVLGWWSL
jgi:hypothetical protein